MHDCWDMWSLSKGSLWIQASPCKIQSNQVSKQTLMLNSPTHSYNLPLWGLASADWSPSLLNQTEQGKEMCCYRGQLLERRNMCIVWGKEKNVCTVYEAGERINMCTGYEASLVWRGGVTNLILGVHWQGQAEANIQSVERQLILETESEWVTWSFELTY